MKIKKVTALFAAGALAAALFAGAACAAESGVTVEKVRINNNGVTLAGGVLERGGAKIPVLEITIDPAVRQKGEVYYLFRPPLDVGKYSDYSFQICSNIRLESEMLSFRFMESNFRRTSHE